MTEQPLYSDQFENGNDPFANIGLAESETQDRGGNTPDLRHYKYSSTAPAWTKENYFTSKAYKQAATKQYAVPGVKPPTWMEQQAEWLVRDRLTDISRKGMDPVSYARRLLAEQPNMSPALLAATVATAAELDPQIVDLDSSMNGFKVKKNLAPGSAAYDEAMGMERDTTTKDWVLPNGKIVRIGPTDFIKRSKDGTMIGAFTQSGQEIDPKTAEGLPAVDPSGGSLIGNAYKGFKWASRNFFAALQLPLEGVTGAVRGAVGSAAEGDWADAGKYVADLTIVPSIVDELIGDDQRVNAWEQTTMGQTIVKAVSGEGQDGLAVDQGTGFFVNPDSEIGQAQRRATFETYTVNGESWTFGRGAATAIGLTPEDQAYRVLSGAVDLSVALFADPVNYVPGGAIAKSLSKATNGRVAVGAALRSKAFNEASAAQLLNRLDEQEVIVAATRQRLDQGVATLDETLEAERVRDALKAEYEATASRVSEYEALDELVGQSNLTQAEATRQAEIEAMARAEAATKDLPNLVSQSRRAKYERELRSDPAFEPQGVTAQTVEELRGPLTELLDRYADDPEELVRAIQRLDGTPANGLRTDMPITRDGIEGGLFDEGTEVVARWTGDTDPQLLNGTARPSQAFMDGVLEALNREVIPGDEKQAGRIRKLLQDREAAWGDKPTAQQRAVVRADVPPRAEAFDTLDGTRYYVDDKGRYAPATGGKFDNVAFLSEKEAAAVQSAMDAGLSWQTKGGNLVGYTLERGEGFNARSFAAHRKNGKSVVDAHKAAGGTVKRVTVRAKDNPKAGLVPFEYGEKAQRMGKPIAGVSDRLPTYREAAFQSIEDATRISGKIVSDLAPDRIKVLRDVLNVMEDNGLTAWFSRYLQQQGIDGMANLTGRGRGFWYGLNPKVDAYGARLTQAVTENLSPALRIAGEPEGLLPGAANLILDLGPEVQKELDYLNRYVAGIDNMIAQRTEGVNQAGAAFRQADDIVADLMAQRDDAIRQINEIRSGAKPLDVNGVEARVKAVPMLRDRAARLDKDIKGHVQRHGKGILRKDSQMRFIEQRRTQLTEEEKVLGALRHTAGMRKSGEGKRSIEASYAMRFLFGGTTKTSQMGLAAMKALTQITDPAVVNRMARGKFDADLSREIAKNAARTDLDEAQKMEALREIFAQRLGLGMTQRIGKDVTSQLAAEVGFNPTMAKVRRVKMNAKDKWQKLVPGTMGADLTDPDDVIQKMRWYFATAGDDLISMEKQDDFVRKIIDLADPEKYASGEVKFGQEAGMRNAIIGAMGDMTSERVKQLVQQTGKTPEQVEEIVKPAFLAYQNSMLDQQKYWQNRLSNNAKEIPYLIDSNGDHLPLPNAHLIAEFANTAMPLPPPDAFAKAVTRVWTSGIGRAEATRFVDELFADHWRSLMLVRPAYIVRNIGEMSIRTFLVGNRSYLRNPMAMAGMAVGDPNGGLMRRTLNKFNSFQNDVIGNDWTRRIADDVEYDDMQLAYHRMVYVQGSLTDMRIGSYRREMGALPLGPSHPNFNRSWAHELMVLRSDPIARVVADAKLNPRFQKEVDAGRMTFQDGLVRTVMADPKIRDQLVSGGETFQRLATDKVAMQQYMFGNKDFSVAARLDQFTGGNSDLVRFVAKGELFAKDGTPMTVKGLVGKAKSVGGTYARDADISSREEALLEALRRYKHEIPDSVLSSMPIRGIDERRSAGMIRRGIDAFFAVSAKAERVGVMGPEFRQAYWDQIAELAPFMTSTARREALANTPDSLTSLVSGGRNIGQRHPAIRALKAEGEGTITLDDANRIAWSRAQDHVRDLFYDASDRQAGWHALRLLMPFGQAWANSMGTVTKLAAKNPTELYRGMRVFHGLEGQQVTEALGMSQDAEVGWFDQNEGLIQTDENGSKYLLIPGLGDILSLPTNALGKVAGVDDPNVEQAAGFDLQNLNVIFGGTTPLPGLGPVGVLTAKGTRAVMGGWDEFDGGQTSWEKTLNEYAFPYGDSVTGSLLPTWMQRAYSAVAGDDLDRWNAPNIKPAMSWLAANGSYDVRSVDGQEELARDSGTLARIMGGVTALASFIGPTTPNYTRIMRDGDDEQIGMASLSNVFYREILPDNDSDYGKAYSEFLDRFGPTFLATISSSTSGGFRASDEAWKKADEYSDAWVSSPDEFSILFPGSRSSIAASQWLQQRDRKQYRTPEERVQGITRILYQAELGRLEKRWEAEQWPDEKIALVKQDLKNAYGPVADDVAGVFGVGAGERIEAMKGWLDTHPEMAEEPSVKAFYVAYDVRQKAKARAMTLGVGGVTGGLASKKAAPLKVAYIQALSAIDETYSNSGLVLDLFNREWDNA